MKHRKSGEGTATEKRENFSRKREAILSALRETDTHPTAEWVYARLKPQYSDLSLGTVYRNLKKFCGAGKALSLGSINGQEHFDGCVSPHAHFVCDQCGRVLDVPGEFFGPEELSALSRESGCRVRAASVLFRGLCETCRENDPDAAEASGAFNSQS